MKRWGEHKPAWEKGLRRQSYDKLRRDLLVDSVVVGGGITGLTTALFLVEAGKRVVVLTDGIIGSGTTGSSTGHLTQVLDEDFQTLAEDLGIDGAKQCVESVTDGISTIERLVVENGISCGFTRVPGYRFSEDPGLDERLMKELEIARELGLEASLTEGSSVPYSVSKMIRFENQAMIDPLRYVERLAAVLYSKGCHIFEESRVLKIEDGQPANVYTSLGNVTAKEIILATHTPVGLYFSLHIRVAPYFSYVMTARLDDPPERGLFWDMRDPYFYLRPLEGDLWIIGGRDHKTGQEGQPIERYLELEEFIRDRFNVKEIVSYWGNEFFNSVDGLPYIGRIPFTKSLFTGTGFSGTGLTFGTVAARLMSDLILERVNPWSSIYDPYRVRPVASVTSFIKENANVARQFISDRITHRDLAAVKSIPPTEGRIVEVGGKKYAVYRDETKHLHVFSPACTHMSCTVHWNGAEKTWDCPCHGGRYKPTGEVFEGPPLRDLRALGVDALEMEEPERYEINPEMTNPRSIPTSDPVHVV